MIQRSELRLALTTGLVNGLASLSPLPYGIYAPMAVLAVSGGSYGTSLELGRQRILGSILGMVMLLLGLRGLRAVPMPLALALILGAMRLLVVAGGVAGWGAASAPSTGEWSPCTGRYGDGAREFGATSTPPVGIHRRLAAGSPAQTARWSASPWFVHRCGLTGRMGSSQRNLMGRTQHRSRGFSDSADGLAWEVGLVTLHATVPGEDGIPYRPAVALVLEGNGALRAMAPGHPDRPQEALAKAISDARDQPAPPCRPGTPRRVVVNSNQLLAWVSPLLPGALVSQGPTPQLKEAAQKLREHMAGGEGQPGLQGVSTYFTNDVTPKVVKEFFEIAAALYDRRPWRRVPADGHLFQVTCLPLGIRNWTGCVIGQGGESYGVLLFDSPDDYRRYLTIGQQAEAGEDWGREDGAFPRHRAINYEPRQAMPPGLLREIKRHDWPVAAGDAFPTILLVDSDLALLPPRTQDWRQLELVAAALCEWLDTEPHLADLWTQPNPRRRRFRIKIGDMTLPVLIRVVERPSQLHLPLALDTEAIAPDTKTVAREAEAESQASGTTATSVSPDPAPTSAGPTTAEPPPKVPAALRERVDSLLARIDPFCASHLNADYRHLIHLALAALARKRPSPLLTGREPSWAAGVVHAIGSANFLFDPSQTPHCAPKAIYDHFGVASSTALNHSKKVRELLD
ncbi:MAG: FUSC family protein, partial [Cyanobacteria bacterium K_Offshore_surface_m2_239]|nr:FUSC family protein [Cyanobacteria bacterium K_Offshore_surface_m2_239]